MEIIDNREGDALDVDAKLIPTRTVFSGEAEIGVPEIFLRAYDCVVSLSDPTRTWTPGDAGLPLIRNYVPLDAVLTVSPKVG